MRSWALEPECTRIEKKAAFSMDEIRVFYDSMIGRIEENLENLDGHFIGAKLPETCCLYLMSLSLVEFATLVELFKRRESVDGCDQLQFAPKRRKRQGNSSRPPDKDYIPEESDAILKHLV